MDRSVAIRRWRASRHTKPSILPRLLLGVVALLFLSLSFLVLLGVGAAAGVYWYFAKDLPPVEALEARTSSAFETSRIYDRTGRELLFELLDPQGGARTYVPLQEIPEIVRHGTIAIEDKDFYDNPGISIEGIFRAAWNNLQGNPIQGGSTLTQQLVKLVLLPEEQYDISYSRKIREAILSLELTRRYAGVEGKHKILEWYLNTVHYGRIAYGIQAAAEQYFGKDVGELTLAEAAMLVAVPQYPLLNPIDDFEAAKRRQEKVLDQLYLQGYISAEEAYEAKQEEVQVVSKPFEIRAPHFVMYVRDLLEKRYGLARVYREGFRVYTTLDMELQQEVRRIANEHIAENREKYKVTNASVVVMNPNTGEIRSMLGSLDYFDSDIDGQVNVATSPRQPGSSFKPFTYVTAFSQGYMPATQVMDVRTSFPDYPNPPYVPENYDRRYHGPIPLRRALACSYNIPAVAVLSWVGIDNVLDTAHRMGITTLNKDFYGLSLTLGGGEVKLLDMAYAYSVFANEGIMAGEPVPPAKQKAGFRQLDPVAILRIEDAEGNVVYEYQEPHSKRIISPQLAYLMSDVLSDNRARAFALGWNSNLKLSRPAAAKTGTTENFRDAWTIGYTPDVVVGVWVGNNDNKPMERFPSVRAAGPIWNRTMEYLFQSMPEVDFVEPSGIEHVVVDEASGLLPTPYSGHLVEELFINGTAPTEYDNVHQPFRVCRASAKLATVHCPPHEVDEQVFEVYPPKAADWVRQEGISQPPSEYCDLHGPRVQDADVTIIQPELYSYVRGVVPIVGNAKPGDFHYWRLQVGEGMNPASWTPITGERHDRVHNNVMAHWDASQLDGLYSLQLTVVGGSGNVQQSAVQVTVDNISPTVSVLNPWPDKEYVMEIDEWVNIQVDAQDNVSMDRVEFFLDDRPIGFSTVAPFTFKWTITMSDIVPSTAPGAIYGPAPVSPEPGIAPMQVITNPDGSVIYQGGGSGLRIQRMPSGMSVIYGSGVYTETHLVHAVAYDSAGNTMETAKVRFQVIHRPPPEEEETETPTPESTEPTTALPPSERYAWLGKERLRLPLDT